MWFISIVTYDEYSSIIVLINMTRFQECAPNIKHIFLWIWSSKHGRISMLSTWFVSSDFKCPVIRTALYINKSKAQYILAKQFPTESRLTLFNTAFSFLSQADFLKKRPMSSNSAFLISNLSSTYSRLDALSHILLPTLCRHHSSEPTLIRSTRTSLSSNTGHCLDLILKHNSSVCLHAIQSVKSLSCVRLFATPWTVAYQTPPSMGFSRQEYWRESPFPSPGDLPDPGIEPRSPALQTDALPGLSHQRSLLKLPISCNSSPPCLHCCLLSLLCGLIVYWYSAVRLEACQGLGVFFFFFLIHAIFLGNSIQDH